MNVDALLQTSIAISLGTLLTLIIFGFKIGSFVSDTKHGITDAKSTGIRAHKRIDKLEENA